MYYSIEELRKKLYQGNRNYKDFRDISHTTIEEIDTSIDKFTKNFINNASSKKLSLLEIYAAALKYLIYQYHISFDEKIIFLIRLCDPDCKTFKLYKAAGIKSEKDLANIQNDKERKVETFLNNERKNAYRLQVRSEIGFFDARLLRFQIHYYKKFVKELLPNCNIDFGDILFSRTYDFTSLEDFEIDFVKYKVNWYKENFDYVDIMTLIYHILFQHDILRLYSPEQQLLLFILLVDPDYDILKIYYRESRWETIESEIRKIFGYYDPRLIDIEKAIYTFLDPDIELDYFK